jgi:hypothetical protein
MTVSMMVAFFAAGFAHGQKQRSRVPAKSTAAEPKVVVSSTADPQPVSAAAKRNERPGAQTSSASGVAEAKQQPQAGSFYEYEFSQPDFNISHIKISQNEAGEGTIAFRNRQAGETITDPVRISAATLEKINAALTSLNFLDSNVEYQAEKDFSHLGSVKVTYRNGGRSRSVSYNWTENKDAKALANEYRKIGNQYIWMFDISVSRENQPLEAPKLLDSLDSLMKRGEISDPFQLLPLLQELTNDERIPLIARNHAGRLVQNLEKEKKKQSK